MPKPSQAWYNGAVLDWYGGLLGYDASALPLDRLMLLGASGDIRWQVERKMGVEGSYSSSIQVGRSCPTPEMRAAAERLNLEIADPCLVVSGNPTKFLQGHNVFGPPVSALAPVVRAMVRAMPDKYRPGNAGSELWPAVHRTRVDITTAVDLGEHRLVHEWLRSAASLSRSRGGVAEQMGEKHGRELVSGDTVYWQKHSRRWSLKAYCKFCELKAHTPVIEPHFLAALWEWCRGQLRLELTLRRPELKDRGTLDEGLLWEYMERLTWGVIELEKLKKMPENLPRALLATWYEWLNGIDVRCTLRRRTFYNHRQAILRLTGADISLPVPKQDSSKQLYDLAWLREHALGELPKYLAALAQSTMFTPEPHPKWTAKGVAENEAVQPA